MREEGNQPHLPEEREYRKLFGLDIYLTPVFVISQYRHPHLRRRGARIPRRRDKGFRKHPHVANYEP